MGLQRVGHEGVLLSFSTRKAEREVLGLRPIPPSISLLSTPPRRRLLLLLTLSKASQLVPTCRSWVGTPSLTLTSKHYLLLCLRAIFRSLASVLLPQLLLDPILASVVSASTGVLTGRWNVKKLVAFTKAKQTPTSDPAILLQRKYLTEMNA